MPLSTGNAPSKASPSKKRKSPPEIEDSMVDPLNRFLDLVDATQNDDPKLRSYAAEQLKLLAPVINHLASAQSQRIHYSAGDFKSLREACSVLGVSEVLNVGWTRSDIDDSSVRPLSPDYESVIHGLKTSKYHNVDYSEASVRVVVELLILDRLNQLPDEESREHLQLYPEVDVFLRRGNADISGRADWLLCHDDPQNGIESALIAVEAKRKGAHPSAAGQIATYLAAILDRRATAAKLHAAVFGITTDGTDFRFWFMDSQRQIFSSREFDWRTEQNLVIAWIDKMLADAIEASPLTTPVLRRNTSLRNWENNFRRTHCLNPGPEDSSTSSGVPLDITYPESGRLIGVFYQGRRVLVVEYEENEENEESSGNN